MAKLFTNEYHLVGTYTSNLRLGKTGWEDVPEGFEAVGDRHSAYTTHREVMEAAEQMRTRGFKVYVYEMNPTPIYEAEGFKPFDVKCGNTDPHGELALCPVCEHERESREATTDYCLAMGFDM